MANVNSLIMGFSEAQAASLAGLSSRQLAEWTREDFFVPEMVSGAPRQAYGRVYSFRDVVALRVLAELRKTHRVTMKELRKASSMLGEHPFQGWADAKLAVLKGHVVFFPDDGHPPRDSDGQYAATIPLERVIGDVRQAAERLRHREPVQHGKLSRDRFVAHNAWTVAGTRIPTAAIMRYHEGGYSTEQILAEYPSLTAADVAAAIEHEKQQAA